MPLVAGVDSSTQSCKVVVRDAHTGALVRQGSAPHPDGTEIHPDHWWTAFEVAAERAGGLDDVEAIAVGGQQHGMVCLDEQGEVVRPALLWNDTRSADAADAMVRERTAAGWVEAVGSVPVASFTVTKLRWLAEHEPHHAERTAAVCLPHDWLTWKLRGTGRLDDLVTDRSDASGTGYFDPRTGEYRRDLFTAALGHDAILPTVLAPNQGVQGGRWVLGPGAGDNAAAGFGVLAGDDAVVSLGTSGTAFMRSTVCPADETGAVAGFADLTGVFLPLVCTLNAARVLDATAGILGVSLEDLDDLALTVAAGADGLAVIPYLEGERTPNLPHASGGFLGLTRHNATPGHFARAAVEGMLCGLADALDALRAQGTRIDGVRLVGGATRSAAVRAIAPTVFGVPVVVPPPSEYVADGAARQAAWVLLGTPDPVEWPAPQGTATYDAPATPGLRERYAEAVARHLDRA